MLTVRGIGKDFGIKELVNDASFTIAPGEKIGLIGANGSGKSTLLKIVGALESADRGEIQTFGGTRIVYLAQEPAMDGDRTVLAQVFASSGKALELVGEYEAVSAELALGVAQRENVLLTRLGELSQELDALGAWELEHRAKSVLSKLGVVDFQARVGDLSGGYRKRIALAAALLAEPDLLLLDEPTNHLDAAAVEWLQDYLQRYRGAVLLITHDRYFLNRVTARILELDRGDLFSYDGNYSYYLEKKALEDASAASSQQKFQGVLRRELAWLQKGPKARSTKQKARIDRIEQMREKEFKGARGKVEMGSIARRLGKKAIVMNGVSKVYEERPVIADFSYEFLPEDRVGVIGSNGAGKSTLLNLITGRIDPDAGTVEVGTTVEFGYFDQHGEDLLAASDGEMRTIDYLKEIGEYVKAADGTTISAGQMLERFLFPPSQQFAPISKLSGGERRRLFLLRILMKEPNILILDEPTNDLDVQTLAVLEEYLEDFSGCAIVVSHDRYFLDRTVDKILACDGTGKVREYPGNYSLYLDYKAVEEAKEAERQKELQKIASDRSKSTPKEITPATPSPAKSTSRQGKPLSNWERREFTELEAKIANLETEKATLETTLYQKPPSGYTALQSLTQQLQDLDIAIDKATNRWLELAERSEL
jgi:ABC transport system ATP-binding/permease protein